MKKRIINVVLSLLLLVSLVPIIKDTKAEVKLPQAAGKVFEQDSKAPEGYNNATDPYDIAISGKEKLLSTQDEILISTFDGGRGYHEMTYKVLDTFKEDKNKDIFPFDFENQRYESSKEFKHKAGEIYYAQSAAFDGDGNGTNEKAAFIGLQWAEKNSHVVVWFVDTVTNYVSPLLDIGAAGWFYDLPTLSLGYKAQNFLRITAGDYHNTGRDTLMIYTVLGDYAKYSWMDPVLYEIKLNGAGNALEFYNKANISSYLNQDYLANREMREDSNYENQLAASLATGDFNGDGIDDLAVLSYLNKFTVKYNYESKIGMQVPNLAIGYGSNQGLPGGPSSSTKVYGIVDKSEAEVIPGYYEKMYYIQYPLGPTIATGDIDNDKHDEIVVGGYYGEAYCQKNRNDATPNDPITPNFNGTSQNKNAIFLYDAKHTASGLRPMAYQKFDSNEWTKGGTWVNSTSIDYVYNPFMVQTAKLDGPANADYVFLNGSVYRYNGSGLEHSLTSDYFTRDDGGSKDKPISVTFITSVVGSNLDGNNFGYEQFGYIVGLKAESDNYYRYYGGLIGRYGEKENRKFCSSSLDTGSEQMIIKGGSDPWAIITAVDNDIDAIRVKYSKRGYAWTNPEVIAILQAAPYFGELGSFDDFNDGSTNYSISQSYENENGKSHAHTLGVGGMVELDAECLEAEVRLGYEGEWSEGSFISSSKSSTFEISAGAYDTVIVKRTPILEFTYDIVDPKTGQWVKDGHYAWVTRDDAYYTMSVDDYNAFVEYYNDVLDEAKRYKIENGIKVEVEPVPFKTITKDNAPSLIGNEGNPYAYDQGLVETNEISALLGHNGGTQSIAYEETNGKGETKEESHGFSYEASMVAGALIKGGMYSASSYLWGHNQTTTEINGKATSGTVCNLDAEAMSQSLNVPTDVLRQYSFNWNYGTWYLDLGGAGNIPVYGYKTSNVSSPTPRVNDLAYTLSDDAKSVRLDWTKPEQNKLNPNIVDGYNIYVSRGNGPMTKVNDALVKDTSYTLLNFDRTSKYEFAVRSVTEINLPAGGKSEVESIYSNIVVHNGDLSGKSSYEIAIENGFIGTEVEYLESLVGPKGDKGADGSDGRGITSIQKTGTNGNLDIYTIYYTDGRYDTFTIANGQDGAAGAAGKDGEAIELQVVNGEIQWKYRNETADEWRKLITIEGNDITIQGLKGNDGADGREIEINRNSNTGMIEWRYVGEETWKELMPINDLKGDDGRDIEFQIEDGHLKWRYCTETIPWTRIGKYEEIIPEIDTSRIVEITVNDNKLKWRYLSSDEEYKATTIAPDAIPDFIKPIKMHRGISRLEWRYIDNSNEWTTLNVTDVEALDIDKTKYVEMIKEDGVVKFRHLNIAEEWHTVMAVEEITGYQNSIMELRVNNGILEYSAYNIFEWQDAGLVGEIRGEDGKDGENGHEVMLQVNEELGIIEWKYDNEETWQKLVALEDIRGLQGERGVGIVSIEKTSSLDNIDTYTITYSDGSNDSFEVINGLDGEKGDKGEKGDQGEKGEKGDQGIQGDIGYTGYTGADGEDGQDGQTPYIGPNGHWFIGDKDTGVQAEVVTISEFMLDEDGKFVFVMSDGSEKNLKNAKGETIGVEIFAESIAEDIDVNRNLATIAIALASVSLLWNLIALITEISKKNKLKS